MDFLYSILLFGSHFSIMLQSNLFAKVDLEENKK